MIRLMRTSKEVLQILGEEKVTIIWWNEFSTSEGISVYVILERKICAITKVTDVQYRHMGKIRIARILYGKACTGPLVDAET